MVLIILSILTAVFARYKFPEWEHLIWLVVALLALGAIQNYRLMRNSIAAREGKSGLRMRVRNVNMLVSLSPFNVFLYSFFLLGSKTMITYWYLWVAIVPILLWLEFKITQILKTVQPVLIAIDGDQIEVYQNYHCARRSLATLTRLTDSKFYFSEGRAVAYDRADFDQDELIDFMNALLLRYPQVEVSDQMRAMLALRPLSNHGNT